MALPTTIKFGAGALYIGDGAGSETFDKICGFTSISTEWGKDTNTTQTPDCDTPDVATFDAKDVISFNFAASFDGVMAKEAIAKIHSAYASTTSRNFKIRIVGAGTGGGTPDLLISGAAHFKYSNKAERGSRFEVSVSLENDGTVTSTSVAAL